MHTARFTIITPTLIRLEHSPSGAFVDAPSLFASRREPAWTVHTVPDRGEPVELDTGRIRLHFTPDGRGFHPDNLWAEFLRGDDRARWRVGLPNTGNLGGTVTTLDTLTERIPLDHGILSREGWFLFDDSRRHIVTDGWVRPRPEASGTDWYLFAYGRDYERGLRDLAAIAGPVPMPRKPMLGSWYSRYWPYSADEFVRIVREHDAHGFPLDILVLDMDWHREGWCGWSWNRSLIPDPERLLRALAERGIGAALNLHPYAGVGPHEDAYPAFMRALGRDPASGETIPYDAADRDYQHALFKHVHRPLEAQGVGFWWLDWQQGELARSIPDLPNLAWLNRLYFEHTRREGRRGASFSRWGGWGDHRHPIHFSGDAHAGWPMLAFEVEMTAAAGNVGCFYWSHDIGGHFGPRNEELITRWVQFGALSPALRVHSTCAVNLDRRPWLCRAPFVAAQRAAYQLRSRLMPAIYAGVRRAHEDTLPLARPMYLQLPADERAYHAPTQYMLGDHLLAAPIVSPGRGDRSIAARDVFFPPLQHADWFHDRTGERWRGGSQGSEAIIAAEIDELPLFLPGGTPIPTQPTAMRMGSSPLERLIIRMYPGRPGRIASSSVYEDDGETRGHERGEFAMTPLEARWSDAGGGLVEVELRIGPRRGAYPGEPSATACEVHLAGIAEVVSATVAGHEVKPAIDGESAAFVLPDVPRDGPPNVAHFRVRAANAGDVHARESLRRLRHALGQNPASAREDAAGVVEALAANAESVPGDFLEMGLGIGVRADARGVRLFDVHGLLPPDAELEVVDVIGDSRARRTLVPGASAPLGCAVIAEALPVLEEPPLGLRSRRRASLAFSLRGRPVRGEFDLDTRSRTLTAWRLVGPFSFDPARPLADQVFEPERLPANADRWYRAGDAWLGWSKAIVAPDGRTVNVWQSMGGRAKVAYLVTHVRPHTPHRTRLSLDVLEGVEAWVNGRKIVSSSALGDVPSTVEAEARLDAGWNRLMLKLPTDSGWWFFRASLDGSSPVDQAVDP